MVEKSTILHQLGLGYFQRKASVKRKLYVWKATKWVK